MEKPQLGQALSGSAPVRPHTANHVDADEPAKVEEETEVARRTLMAQQVNLTTQCRDCYNSTLTDRLRYAHTIQTQHDT
jgi:hypothetical protein